MKKIFCLMMLIMITCALWAGDFTRDADTIRSIMDRQVEAWNRHNIDGFMAGYWKSDELTFQSGNKRRKGWNTLLAMYKKNYAGEKMGKLEFTDIEIKPLTGDYIYVLGRWRVIDKDGVKEGMFTLIFRRFDKDWKIIHDHSS